MDKFLLEINYRAIARELTTLTSLTNQVPRCLRPALFSLCHKFEDQSPNLKLLESVLPALIAMRDYVDERTEFGRKLSVLTRKISNRFFDSGIWNFGGER